MWRDAFQTEGTACVLGGKGGHGGQRVVGEVREDGKGRVRG